MDKLKTVVRKGLEGGAYKLLSEKDIEKINDNCLRVFSEVGVQINLEEARELFRKAGEQVD